MLTRIERVASIAEQKSAVIKENAKYSFVELGKFNTSVYTRRISNSFGAECCAVQCVLATSALICSYLRSLV